MSVVDYCTLRGVDSREMKMRVSVENNIKQTRRIRDWHRPWLRWWHYFDVISNLCKLSKVWKDRTEDQSGTDQWIHALRPISRKARDGTIFMKDQGFRALATIVFYEYCSVVSTMTSMCRLQQRKRIGSRHRSLLEGEKSCEEMVFTY